MLFWIFVILLVVGLVLKKVGELLWDRHEHGWFEDSLLESFGIGLSVFSIIVIAIMAVILLCCHIGVDGDVVENKERYTALTYKVESDACRDEFGLLSKSVLDEVQEWNEDVAWYRTMHDDFWVGIFIPDELGQFKTIDYTKY